MTFRKYFTNFLGIPISGLFTFGVFTAQILQNALYFTGSSTLIHGLELIYLGYEVSISDSITGGNPMKSRLFNHKLSKN